MTVNTSGYVFDDSGSAVSGATVQLLETGTTTEEASTTTNSSGLWSFAEADEDRYDIKVTSGASVRYRNWDDQITVKEIDVRNNTGATTPAITLANITNAVANQVAKFRGANTTRADNDEIYFSFELANSAGELTEFGRMTVVATDVTDASEDGQFEFDVMQGGSLIKAFTIASSTAGAQSIDFNQDAITFGTGTAATDITLTFDAESADGVITWMEDEDYFKFSDDILMNSTERINFGDTGTYIYQSGDGQLDITSDTEVGIIAPTVDIDASTEVNISTDLKIGDDLSLTSDSSVFNMGIGNDFTITHDGTTGATLAGNPITITSAAASTWSTSSGALTITSGAALNLNPTSGSAILLDGTISVDAGVVTGATAITSATIDATTDFTIGDTVITDGVITDTSGLSVAAATTVTGALTVGVDDTGYDVKLFGASAGAYMEWDESEDQLRLIGPSADAAGSSGKLLLATAQTDVRANDILGQIEFQAPLEAQSTDARAIAASIAAVAQDTFTASVNATDLIFYTGHSEAATEKFRFTSQGELGIGGATYGSSGDVLTSGGAGAAPTWATPTTGDITSIVAGDGLTGSSLTSGAATLTVVGGDGITANSDDVAITAAQTTITSVYNASLKMGRDSQNLIDFATTDNKIILRANNVDEVELVANVLQPTTNDGVALGTTSLGWSDLHLATAGVINWANGEMTITEGDANTLTVAGGTFATAALTTSTIVASGVVKTDDTTNATSTTDGSLQTDGGLSVALDAIFGDDVTLITDSAVLNLGVGSDVSITHDGATGGTISGTPIVYESLGAASLANDTHAGVVLEFLAGESIAVGQLVYMSTVDGRVSLADANDTGDSGHYPAIGVAVSAQGSAGSAVKILTHGTFNDSDGFGGDLTEGNVLYLSETAGGFTATAPSDDGDMVQVVGMAIGPRDVFVNPSLDVIEHA